MIPAVLTGVLAQPLRCLRILQQIHHLLGERRGVPVRDEAAGALVLQRTCRGYASSSNLAMKCRSTGACSTNR
jgi:hypothetical protein